MRWRDAGNGALLPDANDVGELEPKLLREGPKCPAATLGRFTDTGRVYVRCGVERNAFAVADSPVAAIKWCCGDYANADGNPIGPCPLWMAAQEKDPALERTYTAQQREATDAQTARQIAAGIRVDDKGHDPDLPMGTRELIEEIERMGE